MASGGGIGTGKPMSVGKAGGIMFVSLLLSRVLGLVRDAVMAGKFGSNQHTDAYRLAFQIPDLLFFLIAGGALSSAFIPVFSEYLHTDREEEAWRIFSVVTTVMSTIVILFIVGAGIFAVPLAHIVAPGKPAELLPEIALMSRIVLPAQFAFFIGGLMFGTLYARGMFAVPALGPNLYNIGIIFGAVVLSGLFVPGVIGMSIGATIGAIVGSLLVPLWAMRKIGARFTPSYDVSHPGVRKVFALMLPVILGLSLPGVYALIMQSFGSYYPTGTNTVLEFANKLMQAPLGVFGQSMAIAAFPALTAFYAQGKMTMYRDQLGATLRTVLFLGVPISVAMGVLAPQIVGAMYLHGSFTPAAADQTSNCLRLFSIGIWAWCLHPVLMRGYYAMHDTKAPVIFGTVTTAFFVLLLLQLRTTSLGYQALPLASSVSAIGLVSVMLFALSKKAGGIGLRRLATTGVKSLVGAVAAGAICSIALLPAIHRVVYGHKGPTVVALLVLGVVAAAAYTFVAKLLRMPEAEYVDRALARLRRRAGHSPA